MVAKMVMMVDAVPISTTVATEISVLRNIDAVIMTSKIAIVALIMTEIALTV